MSGQWAPRTDEIEDKRCMTRIVTNWGAKPVRRGKLSQEARHNKSRVEKPLHKRRPRRRREERTCSEENFTSDRLIISPIRESDTTADKILISTIYRTLT